MKTDPKKINKYRNKISEMIAKPYTSCEDIESLHGCLRYVADVEPFGIPFLAPLMNLIRGQRDGNRSEMKLAVPSRVKRLLCVWDRILVLNKGITMDYMLGRLPRPKFDIFVDASTSWGIGGCWGERFFKTPWVKLKEFTPISSHEKNCLHV